MKNNRFTLFIMLLLTTLNNSMHAYRWIMNNFTTKTLLVQVELLASGRPFFVIVPPKKSGDFDWPPGNTMAGFCLGKIKYVVMDENIWRQSDFINRGSLEVRDSGKVLDWLDKMANPTDAKAAGLSKPYPRIEADLLLYEDELYKQTVAAAQQVTGTKFGAKIVAHFANLVKESKCRSRDIAIVEKNGKIEFYTLAN